MGFKERPPLKALASSRPPMAKSTRSMSRKARRAFINNHHQLEKRRRKAADNGDTKAEASIAAELTALGGLDQYQQASLQGQRLDRGGDTSQLLLEWLPTDSMRNSGRRYIMLEVGSLSTRNACSRSGLFDMVHIDLHSQEPGILQQDFMERPLPESEAEKFEIISFSLVLNFIADAATRGQMLFRSLLFLRNTDAAELPFPSLFLVLPRSCLTNSRYFSESRLSELMKVLGFEKVWAKISQKLAYSLWKKSGAMPSNNIDIAKQEVRPGRMRNNFTMTFKLPSERPVFSGARCTSYPGG